MIWLPYSLVAVFLLGVSMALYKMPSFKGYSSFHSTFWSNFFYFILALLTLVIFGNPALALQISWWGILWGALFAATMLQQKILLKRAETNTLLPVTSSLSNIVTVALGVFLLSEKISPVQIFGVIVIFVAIFLFTRKRGKFPVDAHSLILSVGIITVSIAAKYVQKFGATHDSILHFSFYQALGATLSSLVLIFLFERKTLPALLSIRHTWKVSLAIAVLGTVAGLALLRALSVGPLSGVYAIQPSYIFITAIVGAILYKEILTFRKIALILVTIAGIILIKIG